MYVPPPPPPPPPTFLQCALFPSLKAKHRKNFLIEKVHDCKVYVPNLNEVASSMHVPDHI
jgi:hypothetical protein